MKIIDQSSTLYRVIGVLQSQINGQWSERPTSTNIIAASPEQACAGVLARLEREARTLDPYAISRWHSPELVRAIDLSQQERAPYV